MRDTNSEPKNRGEEHSVNEEDTKVEERNSYWGSGRKCYMQDVYAKLWTY